MWLSIIQLASTLCLNLQFAYFAKHVFGLSLPSCRASTFPAFLQPASRPFHSESLWDQ